MAGTLTISTLSDGTNSTSATNCIQGSAKAWINYKGTATVAIRGSYNVSSVTVNGSGDYTINFTNAMANANYATIGSASTNASDFRTVVPSFGPSWVYSTTQVRIGSAYQTGVADCPNVYVAVFSS
jgi:hypothetical protein